MEHQIFLKGEAYFNVSKDADHPFIVNANDLNVGVLGTQFNVSSYLEDKSINTVLVEGSEPATLDRAIPASYKQIALFFAMTASWMGFTKNLYPR